MGAISARYQPFSRVAGTWLRSMRGDRSAVSTGGLRVCKGVRPTPCRAPHGSGHPNFPVHTPTSPCTPNFPIHTSISPNTPQFPCAHPTALRRAPYLGAGGEAERSGTVTGTQNGHGQRQLSRGSPAVPGPLPAPSASGDLGRCQAGAVAVTCPQGEHRGGHTPASVSPAPRGARAGCAKHPVSMRFGHGRAVLRVQLFGVFGLLEAMHVPAGALGTVLPCQALAAPARLRVLTANGLWQRGACEG